MPKSEQSEQTELVGNTDTTNSIQSKHWCFTYNNYSIESYDEVLKVSNDICVKYVIGKEVGKQGTPHLQGYIELKKKNRLSNLKKLFNNSIHWERTNNIDASIKYCMKDNDYVTYGLPKPLKVIDKLYNWQNDIVNIVKSEPNDRHVYWIYESTGNVGKSALVKYLCVKYNCVFIDEGKKSDIMNIMFNADMNKCNTVVMDIPRGNANNVSYKSIESIKNGMICNTKYETGMKIFNSPHVIVFANYPPDITDKNLSVDRWMIYNIVDNNLVHINVNDLIEDI